MTSHALPRPAVDLLNREAHHVAHIELRRLRTPLNLDRVTPGSFGPAYLRSLQVLSGRLANFLHVVCSFVLLRHVQQHDGRDRECPTTDVSPTTINVARKT